MDCLFVNYNDIICDLAMKIVAVLQCSNLWILSPEPNM